MIKTEFMKAVRSGVFRTEPKTSTPLRALSVWLPVIGLLAWVAFTGVMTLYWATRHPLNSYNFDLSKKGKPEGVLLDVSSDKKKDFDIQTNAKGHWTVVVFAALADEVPGYSAPKSYTNEVNAAAGEIGDQMTALSNLLRNKGLRKQVNLWMVRVDPSTGASSSWRHTEFSSNCVRCMDEMLTAAHTKDGRYSNVYDSVYTWLYQEWYYRKDVKKNGRIASTSPEFSPTTVILDPDGEIRTITTGLLTAQTYATLMDLLHKEAKIDLNVAWDGIRPENQRETWHHAFFRETYSFVVGMIGLVIGFFIITGVPSRWHYVKDDEVIAAKQNGSNVGTTTETDVGSPASDERAPEGNHGAIKVIGWFLLMAGLMCSTLYDDVQYFTAEHGLAKGTIYWGNLLVIAVSVTGVVAGISMLLKYSTAARIVGAFIGVLIIANTGPSGFVDENLPLLASHGVGDDDLRDITFTTLDKRLVRDYHAIINRTPYINWKATMDNSHPHNRGMPTMTENSDMLLEKTQKGIENLRRNILRTVVKENGKQEQ